MKCHDFYLLFVTKYKFKLIKGLNKKESGACFELLPVKRTNKKIIRLT